MKKCLSATLSFLIIFLFSVFFPKNISAQENFGFNIHSLAKESEEFISCTLNWLANNCQTSIIRLWAYQSTFGINGLENLQKVLDAAPPNIKFIVALEDFPFGPAVSNPKDWFSSGYRNQYRSYVQQIVNKYKNNDKILVWEIMNEPHCKGESSCLPFLYNFFQDIAQLIKSIDPSTLVSPGLMGGEIPWEEYEKINNIPQITATSCHYNTDTNNVNTCLEAINHKGNTQFFYVGEAGYLGNANCSGGGCTNSDCTNCCSLENLQQRARQIETDRNILLGSGASAFLIWQFSPPQNPLLICDKYSVFPGDPLCQAKPFTCSPSSPFHPVTISSPSDISVHFVVTREKDTGKKTEILPLPTPSGVQGTSTNKRNITGQSFDGEVSLLESKFPNFQIFQKTMSSGLQRLLPYSLSQNLILPGDTTVYYRIFAQSKSQPDGDFDPSTKTECHQAPKGKFTIEADKWGRLAGAMQGLCSFLGINVCPAISNFQFQLEEPDYPCDVGSFGPGAQAAEVKNPPPKTENKNFKVKNAFIEIIETIEEIISNVITRITSTKERKEVQFLHHGKLAAGHTTVENSEWLYGFLPQEVIQKVEPRDELKALEEGFRYQYSFSPVETNEHQGEYLELRKMRNAYLMFRCALSPSGSGYAEADPLYKSCNPNDFSKENEQLIKPIPKPPNVSSGCHWDAAAGCDYYDCMVGEQLADGTICRRSCDLDPICESGLCTKNKLYTKPFLEDGTYCPNKQCHPGECYWIHFSHPSSYYYPDYDLPENGPPWGPFYTKNPDVCMKSDGMGCNPDCCQGSETREYD